MVDALMTTKLLLNAEIFSGKKRNKIKLVLLKYKETNKRRHEMKIIKHRMNYELY